MRSTGEVMGIDRTFGLAFAKSQAGGGQPLPRQGTVFLSLADRDKAAGLVAARRFAELGFAIAATAGTAARARSATGSRSTTVVAKVGEARSGVDAVDLIASGKVDLVVNTPRGPRAPGRRRAHPPGRDRPRRRRASPRWPPRWPPRPGIAEWAPHASPTVRSLQEYHRDGQLRLEV